MVNVGAGVKFRVSVGLRVIVSFSVSVSVPCVSESFEAIPVIRAERH